MWNIEKIVSGKNNIIPTSQYNKVVNHLYGKTYEVEKAISENIQKIFKKFLDNSEETL